MVQVTNSGPPPMSVTFTVDVATLDGSCTASSWSSPSSVTWNSMVRAVSSGVALVLL